MTVSAPCCRRRPVGEARGGRAAENVLGRATRPFVVACSTRVEVDGVRSRAALEVVAGDRVEPAAADKDGSADPAGTVYERVVGDGPRAHHVVQVNRVHLVLLHAERPEVMDVCERA